MLRPWSGTPLLAGLLLAASLSSPSAAEDPPIAGEDARSGTWAASSGAPPVFRTATEFAEWIKEARRNVAYQAAGDRIVVKLIPGVSLDRFAGVEGVLVEDRLGPRIALVGVPRGTGPRAFARSLDESSLVRYAEPDQRVASMGQSVDWGVEAIQAPAAHTAGATGAGVIVAVVDTGVDYRHEDLKANIWTNPGEIPGNGIDDDGNGYRDDVHGWDFIGPFYTSVQEDDDPNDVNGHGTHVAGIVAAADNDVGVVGVAPGAAIMAVKALDDEGYGFASTVAKGIHYAVNSGADIINLSLGGYQPSSLLRDAVRSARAAGVTVVAAAGNDFFYSIPMFPAGYPETISVAAASGEDQSKTWWSNWGKVDFLAPGEEILSAIPDDRYARFSGTSMSAPHVAGALALIAQQHPGFGPDELVQALAATADDRYAPGKDEVSGSGFPNAAAAVGPLPSAQFELYADPYLIPSDGTEADIFLRVLDADGVSISGAAGSFASDRGSVSDPVFTTDAEGQARTSFSLSNHWGVATVTASLPGLGTRDIRLVIEDDRVRVDEAAVIGAGAFHEEPWDWILPHQILMPGEQIEVKVKLGNHRFGDPKRASIAFTVFDPGGAPVPGASGEIEPTTVGDMFPGVWYSQRMVHSNRFRVPFGYPAGTYRLDVTATTEGTGKVDHYSIPFQMGRSGQVLIIRNLWNHYTSESLNYGDGLYTGLDWGYSQILDDLGLTFDVVTGHQVQPRELRRYSTVVWLGDFEAMDQWSVEEYLLAGGNIILSGEQWATHDRTTGGWSSIFWDKLHLTGVWAWHFPDANHHVFPGTVQGLHGGPFQGETLDIDSYDLGTTGETTAFVTDEIVLQNAGPETTGAFAYADGVHSPALAGAYVDNGRYRVFYAGFGIEAIDDAESSLTVGGLLERTMEAFNPPPSIEKVDPKRIPASRRKVLVTGTGFQRTGTTQAFVGKQPATVNVMSRTRMKVTLPSGLRPRFYKLTIINPLGDKMARPRAIRVLPRR